MNNKPIQHPRRERDEDSRRREVKARQLSRRAHRALKRCGVA